jgi:membrane protein
VPAFGDGTSRHPACRPPSQRRRFELNFTDRIGRVEEWAGARRLRILGRNPVALTLHVIRRFIDVRVTGLAAEMTYYTVLSLVPLLTAFAAALGWLEGFLGAETVRDLEEGVVESLGTVLSDELTEDVAAPLVRELLAEQRTGVAVGGLLVAVWLAGRVFRAAIRALDDAYEVEERRTLLQQWVLSVLFLLGAVLVGVVTLAMFVVGPLLGGGRRIAEWAGADGAWELLWDLGRWPLMAAVGIGFLIALYLWGPNVENSWRQCLPGAVVATVALVLVAVGFQLYLSTVGTTAPDIDAREEAVGVAAQLLGTLAAALTFLWLSNMCMILGGVVNAEWSATEP